ncbi:unnamed protein product [Hymenolepis diminuta]|uniref:Uncharacterized protein n=1 Tax=Hymenolepis diminuta TaxID=6216 RepID=A0A0R3SJL1_HYMDI|nr:unnamed protein product [Hymenolepis diminuta]
MSLNAVVRAVRASSSLDVFLHAKNEWTPEEGTIMSRSGDHDAKVEFRFGFLPSPTALKFAQCIIRPLLHL